MACWTDAFPLDKLAPGAVRTFKQGATQVAVFRLADGSLRAVDNRCPHEGYPLSQGTLSDCDDGSGCLLTCQWHNWKFSLDDGRNQRGGEDLRTFPVRVVHDTIQLDLSPPDPAAELPRLWTSLEQGLVEYGIGRATRDAARLLQLGVSPAEIAAAAAAHDARRARYGSTHDLPVAADVLRFLPRYPGPQAAIPLAQALDIASFAHAWRPLRPLAPAEDPGPDAEAAGEELARRVEAEDAAGAEALLRGALARGWGRQVLEPWLHRVVSEQFLSFGHRLIYQTKVFDLLEAAGWARAEDILCGHLFGIIGGTREDLLPPWRAFHRHTADLDLDALWAVPTNPSWDQREAVVQALVSGSLQQALDAVVGALRDGAGARAVVDALSLAGAERMLRFDVAHDGNQGIQDDWLSVTHIQTHAAAVRAALEQWPDPRVLRHLLYAARFTSHHQVLDGSPPVVQARAGTTDQLLAAVQQGDAPTAMGIALSRPPGLADALCDLALSDVAGAPIVQAHVIKNTLVGLDETEHTGDPRPLLALVRLLSSPLQQRWVQRTALEAVAFVTEGTVPRLLAP